ncbi:hypothetical protein CMUS01_06078 [Colletotrichum musicola]|uniref:Uncharacterized protein n=1 Tax=Colletotrichum musicola TaxID=2175873 RepID=A0A8H6KN77_9PEZI|nr:hypothetical protein CMUS01_06078 [Colletotrichum musicola]
MHIPPPFEFLAAFPGFFVSHGLYDRAVITLDVAGLAISDDNLGTGRGSVSVSPGREKREERKGLASDRSESIRLVSLRFAALRRLLSAASAYHCQRAYLSGRIPHDALPALPLSDTPARQVAWIGSTAMAGVNGHSGAGFVDKVEQSMSSPGYPLMSTTLSAGCVSVDRGAPTYRYLEAEAPFSFPWFPRSVAPSRVPPASTMTCRRRPTPHSETLAGQKAEPPSAACDCPLTVAAAPVAGRSSRGSAETLSRDEVAPPRMGGNGVPVLGTWGWKLLHLATFTATPGLAWPDLTLLYECAPKQQTSKHDSVDSIAAGGRAASS